MSVISSGRALAPFFIFNTTWNFVGCSTQDFCHRPLTALSAMYGLAASAPGTFDAPDAKIYRPGHVPAARLGCAFTELEQDMAREELKWQNIDADDLPAAVTKSFDGMVEAETTFKADLEKLLKAEGHMPEDKFLVMSRKGKRLGVAFASTPRGEGGAGSLKFKTK
jgi:hypothetical protein